MEHDSPEMLDRYVLESYAYDAFLAISQSQKPFDVAVKTFKQFLRENPDEEIFFRFTGLVIEKFFEILGSHAVPLGWRRLIQRARKTVLSHRALKFQAQAEEDYIKAETTRILLQVHELWNILPDTRSADPEV